MKIDTSRRLSDVLTEVLRDDGTAKKMLDHHAEKLWGSLMGPTVQNATSSVRVRDGVMFVGLTSSVVRNELLHMKGLIISSINKAAGQDAVKDIIFR